MTDDNLYLTADDEARVDAILRSMTEEDLGLGLDDPPALQLIFPEFTADLYD